MKSPSTLLNVPYIKTQVTSSPENEEEISKLSADQVLQTGEY